MKRQKARQQQKKIRTRAPKSAASNTFSGHIAEIRSRLFFVAIVFLIGSTLAYVYRQPLIDIILRPLGDQQLIYLTPGGGFSFIFQVSFYTGLIVALPVIAYHIYQFLRPLIPPRSQQSAIKIGLFASLLITAGVVYGYFIAIPAAVHFLSTFAEGFVTPSLTADSYLSFFLAYTGGLAAMSLLPLIVMFWHWVSPLTPGGLLKGEQWVIPLAFIAAAVITPTPDILNQLMIAGPVIALYHLGVAVVVVSIVQQKRHSRQSIRPVEAIVQSQNQPAAMTPVFAHQMTAEVRPPQAHTQPIAKRPHPSPPSQVLRKRSLDGFSTGVRRPARTFRVTPRQPEPVRTYIQPRRTQTLSLNGML